MRQHRQKITKKRIQKKPKRSTISYQFTKSADPPHGVDSNYDHSARKELIISKISILNRADSELSAAKIEKETFLKELSHKICEIQHSFSVNRDYGSLADREKPVYVLGVKIAPGTMIFKDAYEGKKFNQTVTITNCGKHSVAIRIFTPTSTAFRIKPIKIGRILPSGMSLVRKIKYCFTKPTAIPQALMDIYINNTCHRYELLVVTCYTQINVHPKMINFGKIDVGMVSSAKYFTITNTGTKQAQFSIDLGRNQLEVMIHPIKGTVQPHESKKISVEVIGTSEGEFKQEFWIKTEPLQRVHIQGNFIEPSFKVDYPLCDNSFLILNFPKTFIGVTQQRNVVIRNRSSTSAVFCVMGRTKEDKVPVKISREEDINYRQFYINPTEGRLHSNQQYIMGVTFAPQKPKNRPPYYVCAIIVDVKWCRVGNAPKATDQVPESQNCLYSSHLDTISILTMDEQGETEQEIPFLSDMVTVVMYGEVEIPHITMQPRKISLKNLKVNEIHSEQLKILNNSKTLPLIIKYNKVACVEVEPKTILLPPNQKVDATVRIKPSKMGDNAAVIVFDVFYRQHQHDHNIGKVNLSVFYYSEQTEHLRSLKLLKKRKAFFVPGITPLITREVGYEVEDVKFNSKIEMPMQAIVDEKYTAFNKANDALIAFPNDRPKVLRPWKNTVPCKTIFAQLPRLVTEFDEDYDLKPEKKHLHDTTHTYYKNYIKSLSSKHQPKELDESMEDYITTNQKLILMQHLKMREECPSVMKNPDVKSLFIPLSPYQLHNLIVSPKFIQLGKLGAHTECPNHFKVENKNDIPVHVSIKALYLSITIHQEQFILAANSQKNINFTYHSDSSGNHHIPVFVILNFFHVFDVTVLAKIVSNTVKCVTKNIMIVPTEKTAFLELRNPINSDVKFMIDTTFFHLESFPSSGIIPAKRNMICTITFNPEVGYMPVKEIAVVSESGTKELVEVHFDRKRAAIGLNTTILDFGEVPLNTTVSKELIINNTSDQLVPVNIEIDDSDAFPDICIEPMRALLWQKGDIAITFTLKLKEVVNFRLPVRLIFQYEYSQIITITGSVIFPVINLHPPLIKIQKIPSGSVVTAPFRVTNISTVTNYISFPVCDFPEFIIKTRSGEDVTNGVTIAPKERKELYLEFSPQEPVAYCIYFPYILNGILGPPELNCPDTLKCSKYLSAIKNDYKTPTQISPKLKFIKILCAAGKTWLNFSCLEMKFSIFKQNRQEFVATNISNVIHEVTFKTKNTEAFQFISSKEDILIKDNIVVATLEPEESVKIIIEFNPPAYGLFEAEVPIYVKDYSETAVFNCLKLSGTNPQPQILPSKTACYFVPVNIGSILRKNLTLELIAHTCNGDVTVHCGNSHIEVFPLKMEIVSNQKIVRHYIVAFSPTSDCTYETNIKFSCSCLVSAEVQIYACGDSSTLINFMADPAILDQSTYPFFPTEDDKSDYANFMRYLVPIIERWLYSQGYMYQNYYKIPDEIARFPVITEGEKMKTLVPGKTKTVPQLPLVQLLINLINKSILKYIDNGIQPSDTLRDMTVYNYVTYRNTISFLKSQRIFVPGLRPEHLLQYREYREFKENLVDQGRPLTNEDFTENEFYRFSKQKWLDLFFRIYKVLVFERIMDPVPTEEENKQGDTLVHEFLSEDKEAFNNYFQEKRKRLSNWFSSDAKLLLWLEYHYNRQRSMLWPEEKFEKERYFDQFANVDDSVALATVTAAYCPYLIDKLKDVYACPKKLEHKVHNACRVVQVWKTLKLSFDIHPQSIVNANRLKIVFIVTYLYEVLPHYYPTNDVKIEAPISGVSAYELNVSNCGDDLIKYVPIFFGEESNLFQLNNQQILISPKQSTKIRLTYFAKKVLEAKSILVLSGEACGHKYAKTMAISITGIPNRSECPQIDVTVYTYEPTRRKIAIKSPYEKIYSAKIYMCFEEPKSYKDFHAVSVIRSQNIPREVTVLQNECNFSEKDDAKITLDFCFVSQGVKCFYLYFCNDIIGDFCVLMKVLSITPKTNAAELLVNVPITYSASCSCKERFNIHCPKAFQVNIPCRNPSLWRSTCILVQRSFSDASSVEMFKKFFGTPLVFRILKFYLERFPQGFMLPSNIFEDQAEFKITPNKKYYTQPRSTLKIQDVTLEDCVPLIIHWNDPNIPEEEIIELKNTNEKEIRYFKLMFLKPVIVPVVSSVAVSVKPSVISSKALSSTAVKSG